MLAPQCTGIYGHNQWRDIKWARFLTWSRSLWLGTNILWVIVQTHLSHLYFPTWIIAIRLDSAAKLYGSVRAVLSLAEYVVWIGPLDRAGASTCTIHALWIHPWCKYHPSHTVVRTTDLRKYYSNAFALITDRASFLLCTSETSTSLWCKLAIFFPSENSSTFLLHLKM